MGDFRIGSVLGFEIRIDLSWFVIFFLFVWTFTAVIFPASVPGLSTATYIGMGIASTLLFFVSLLAHELSHSLVARAKGIPVDGITLFIFGGVARTRMEAETPGDEFKIAIVGPISSLIIGGVLWLIAWIGVRSGWSAAVTGSAQYLGFLNIVLAVFNMAPGFPLDGGRVLRSIAWKATGDVTRATRLASTAGKWFGYLLIFLGVLQLIQGFFVGGLWLAFIGWFLRNAAIASYQQHTLRQALEGVPAHDAMTRDPETVLPDLTLQQVVDEHFMRRRNDAYPVAANGRPLGLITLEQVRGVPREEWPSRTVDQVMTPVGEDVVTDPDEPMTRVLEKMERTGTRSILVARDGHLEGIITGGDLTGWLRRMQELGGR